MESILKDVLPLEKGQKMVCVDLGSADKRAVERYAWEVVGLQLYFPFSYCLVCFCLYMRF